LKKVWEAKEKKKLDERKEEEMRIQYEREQEMLNNKALLGDEKAKLGLSFMYDAPTGMTKKEEPKEAPKFEWQRKYNAPREEWAKGNEAIQDQPFGIQVRNVRCVKCHSWGHLNTDRECPLFNMSGNADNPGQVTNPSDVLREIRQKDGAAKKEVKKKEDSSDEEELGYEAEPKAKPVSQVQLLEDMKEDHGLKFKKNILHNIRSDDVLTNLGSEKKSNEDELEGFLGHLSPDQRKRIIIKTYGKNSKEYRAEKARQKALKAAKKAAKAKKEVDSDEELRSVRKSHREDKHPKQKRHSQSDSDRNKKHKKRSSSTSSEDSVKDRKRRRRDSESEKSRRRDSDEGCREKARGRRGSNDNDERRNRSTHRSRHHRRSRSPSGHRHIR